jgi:hypothetical protein
MHTRAGTPLVLNRGRELTSISAALRVPTRVKRQRLGGGAAAPSGAGASAAAAAAPAAASVIPMPDASCSARSAARWWRFVASSTVGSGLAAKSSGRACCEGARMKRRRPTTTSCLTIKRMLIINLVHRHAHRAQGRTHRPSAASLAQRQIAEPCRSASLFFRWLLRAWCYETAQEPLALVVRLCASTSPALAFSAVSFGQLLLDCWLAAPQLASTERFTGHTKVQVRVYNPLLL